MEWLKLGVIEPAQSKYNSLIVLVLKKNGGIRLVQDFRALNGETHIDKHWQVQHERRQQCIGEIGRSRSTIFWMLDLTARFWQMMLETSSCPYTVLTVSKQGQFQWVILPMGLLGCPASFQRMMKAYVKGLEGIIQYINDLLVHLDTYDKQVQILVQLFEQ